LWPQQDVLSVLREREAALESIGSEFQGYWVGHWKWEIFFFLLFLNLLFYLVLIGTGIPILYVGVEFKSSKRQEESWILTAIDFGIKYNSLYVEGLVLLWLCIYLLEILKLSFLTRPFFTYQKKKKL
jgi:hypothetical protein